jgi:hypothetical protein
MTQTKPFTSQWIDVNEHLPPEGETVLACGISKNGWGSERIVMTEARFNPSCGWISILTDVSFWTEMPDLPIKKTAESKVEE